MVKIGISGDESEAVEETLKELLKMSDVKVFSYDSIRFATFKQLQHEGCDVFIAPVGAYLLEKTKDNIDVLVLTGGDSVPKTAYLNLINEDALIIVNADDKKIYKYLVGSKANLLTYGFNAKASVTASSIEESMEKEFIQICIQRSFNDIRRNLIEAKEIPITLSAKENGNILNEIAAITAALALGINIRTISLAY